MSHVDAARFSLEIGWIKGKMGKLRTISDDHLNEIFEVRSHGGVEKKPQLWQCFLEGSHGHGGVVVVIVGR